MVQGFLALAPPFGGSSSTVLARVSGAFDYLLPWLSDEVAAVLSSGGGGGGAEGVKGWMYNLTLGMPGVAMLMPYAEAFGGQTVSSPGLEQANLWQGNTHCRETKARCDHVAAEAPGQWAPSAA